MALGRTSTLDDERMMFQQIVPFKVNIQHIDYNMTTEIAVEVTQMAILEYFNKKPEAFSKTIELIAKSEDLPEDTKDYIKADLISILGITHEDIDNSLILSL